MKENLSVIRKKIYHQHASCGDGAVGKSWTSGLRIAGSKPLGGDWFSSKVNFDDILSNLTKISKLTVWPTSPVLHQSLRVQTDRGVASPDFVSPRCGSTRPFSFL